MPAVNVCQNGEIVLLIDLRNNLKLLFLLKLSSCLKMVVYELIVLFIELCINCVLFHQICVNLEPLSQLIFKTVRLCN